MIIQMGTDVDESSILWKYKESDEWKRADIDDLIRAYEDRPKGRWVDYTEDGYVECPFCHSATTCDGNKDELHFCFSCGADMRGDDSE